MRANAQPCPDCARSYGPRARCRCVPTTPAARTAPRCENYATSQQATPNGRCLCYGSIYCPGTAPAVQQAAVVELKLVPVAHLPLSARWTPAEQAESARVLSHEMAALMSEYGAGVVLAAVALALRADLQTAAERMRCTALALRYETIGDALTTYAANLDAAEQAAAQQLTDDR